MKPYQNITRLAPLMLKQHAERLQYMAAIRETNRRMKLNIEATLDALGIMEPIGEEPAPPSDKPEWDMNPWRVMKRWLSQPL